MSKRKECGCHEGCTMLPHECEKPCVWPQCLTPSEVTELLDEIDRDNLS